MLVEFMRTQTSTVEGEDDEVRVVEHRLHVNPAHVSAVVEILRDPCPIVVIRMADGRGFKVRGTYSEVVEKLQAHGGAL